MQKLLIALTDFGDTGLTGAIACIVAASLLWAGNRKAALFLLLSFFGAATAIATAKIIALQCSDIFAPWHIHSPSGHAALSIATYGAVAVIAARPEHGMRRFVITSLAVALIAAVAVTRVMLGAHTIEEVAAGLLIGGMMFAAVWVIVPRENHQPIDGQKLILSLIIAALIFHGMRLNAEAWLRHLALHIGGPLGHCRF